MRTIAELRAPSPRQRVLFTPPPPVTPCAPPPPVVRREPPRAAAPPPLRRGPVKARRSPAPVRPDLELPRHWSVDFEVLDGVNAGKVRLTSPQARGWAKVIRPFPDAVKEAITEARLYVAEQGQASWRGTRTSLDVLTAHDDPDAPPPPKVADVEQLQPRAGLRWQRRWSAECEVRPDQAGLEQWNLLPGDRWLSPKGREWAQAPKGLRDKRLRAGLPVTYEEQCRWEGVATVHDIGQDRKEASG